MNHILRTFISICTVATLQANAQEPVFHEDFTDGIPSTFSLFDRDGLTPKEGLGYPSKTAWAAWTDPDDADNGIAASVSYYTKGGAANDWMVLPKIQMPEDSASCQLYWRSRSAYDTFKDGYAVVANEQTNYSPKQLIDKDLNWSFVRQVQNNQNPSSWNAFTADLSAYRGKEIYLAFVNNTPDGWMLFLDDITLGSRESVEKARLRLTTAAYALDAATITATLKAGILDTLTTFTARLTSEDDTLTEKVTIKKSLLPNAKTTLTLKNKLSGTPATIRPYKVELLEDDRVFATDSGSVTFLAALVGQKAVVAEGLINRGQNGGYGPRLLEAYKKASEKYGDSFIGIQVHGPTLNEDDLTAPGLDDYRSDLLVSQEMGYGQGVRVDRLLSGDAYAKLNSLCASRQSMPLLCTMDIEGTCDDETVSATAACVFGFPLAQADLRYEWLIVEDNISSSQWNLYSGGLFGKFEGYENQELDVSVVFNGVLRSRLSEADMTFAHDVAELDTVAVSLTLSRDFPVLDASQLRAILLVIDEQTGEIVNAAQGTLAYTGSNPVTGITHRKAETSETTIAVYDLTGTLLSTARNENQINIPEKGIYIIKKYENGSIQTYKIRK